MAKVGKVANPPQKPTARNNFHPGVSKALFSKKPYIKPISRHPVKFTKKVPKGKVDGKLFCKKREARNWEMLPRNPPDPIIKSVFIISISNTLITSKVYCKVKRRVESYQAEL